MLTALIVHEDEDALHRGRYLYLSTERSDRTGEHLWTERVVETRLGRIRYLIAEDGKPLSPERAATERARIVEIGAHPDAFQRREQALKNDETRAKQMLQLLPKAFLFDSPAREGPYLKLRFRPDPAYSPQSMEDRVLASMSGTITVEENTARLHVIEGRLSQDVLLGFGLIATIKSGSSFATTRDRVEGSDWKTASLDTDINGRAIFFKAIAKRQHSEHSGFKHLADDLSFEQAVALALAKQ